MPEDSSYLLFSFILFTRKEAPHLLCHLFFQLYITADRLPTYLLAYPIYFVAFFNIIQKTQLPFAFGYEFLKILSALFNIYDYSLPFLLCVYLSYFHSISFISHIFAFLSNRHSTVTCKQQCANVLPSTGVSNKSGMISLKKNSTDC